MSRIALHPSLVVWWNHDGPVVRNVSSGVTLFGDAPALDVLSLFDHPREVDEAATRQLDYTPARVEGKIRLLRRLGFLVPEDEARRQRSRIAVWKDNVASALHHSASSDLRYARTRRDFERIVRERTSRRRPALFKRYRKAPRFVLPSATRAKAELENTLETRRTVRKFTRRPVRLEDLGAVLRGTFGRTGRHDGGPFGTLWTKTSPSAGSLHPIECYVVTLNVEGLGPGLYHFDVAGDELRRLRRGHFRAEAVRAVSGQAWVARAAFLCVLTAVVSRSLWKYPDEVTYRTLFLDAGHLGQTFCLISASRGLGPFTTAAIQDTFIAKLLGLEGASEFPVYLCGAGIPARP
jgi:SagB-type dehydrogenase family enzyme